ncbi:alpha/beta fold hydrolase [Amycolatopsis anabasis]|uniref:alpha/beta fold hydrolase n=1 Tax=Amycolatopsis anabasis TaxID=1840409 RepID=UPI001FE3C9FE|nr:alpha/beta hydrolase [Amycolatopsis anabasis]
MRRAETTVPVGGAELRVETFGDAGDPAVLLIMGMSAAMDWWEDEFCTRLANAGRFVIRYDHRDTGRSTSYPPGAPGYTGEDLFTDPVRLLDGLGVARAHVVGLSMGGAIAQLVALGHPGRIASLTLIATSGGPGDPDLPPSSPRLHTGELPEPDWADRAAVLDYLVADFRRYAAESRPFDEAGCRAVAERVLDRTRDIAASMTNHGLLSGGEPWRSRPGRPRHRGSAVPARPRHRAGRRDPRRPAAHRGTHGTRTPAHRLGHRAARADPPYCRRHPGPMRRIPCDTCC